MHEHSKRSPRLGERDLSGVGIILLYIFQHRHVKEIYARVKFLCLAEIGARIAAAPTNSTCYIIMVTTRARPFLGVAAASWQDVDNKGCKDLTPSAAARLPSARVEVRREGLRTRPPATRKKRRQRQCAQEGVDYYPRVWRTTRKKEGAVSSLELRLATPI